MNGVLGKAGVSDGLRLLQKLYVRRLFAWVWVLLACLAGYVICLFRRDSRRTGLLCYCALKGIQIGGQRSRLAVQAKAGSQPYQFSACFAKAIETI
ncbi:hypothetical protein HMPREF9371_0462 [Neisseria shayeganii 871]|uniref:Uncharacterized protein n=1 Tax=Neisseria shayeganii 871 TaxID=1032488 RepID=G4CFP2_9NEIS|nr:hypothetical protein HMPREF9371_0462 [Neisseria shayeganii 871]